VKIAIAGASGRMGRVLTRIVHETEGLEIAGGIESKGAPSIGADMGELAGIGPLGVAITDDPLPLFTRIEGLIDFTVPQASLALA
jgi:4-hydroxy-tetrahydrodipicolinate reductase